LGRHADFCAKPAFSQQFDGVQCDLGVIKNSIPATLLITALYGQALVKVEGLVDKAGGEIILLKGMVSDRNGVPLDGLRIEIWQTDVNGKYLHSGDNRNLEYDKGFQGFGHDITDSNGNYIFRTIKPTQYPGRTPHIHVKICEGEKELLTTQFYIKDYPDNHKDGIFSRMSESEADSVSMIFSEDRDGTETIVNIVVKSW